MSVALAMETSATVVLSTGELAVVVESNPDPERIHQPKVRIVTDQTQHTVAALLADLSHPDHKGRAIRHCVDPEKYGINSSHYAL